MSQDAQDTLVKICGLTNIDDALDAIELGADFLGFNFYPQSPRFIEEEQAFQLFQEIPTNIPKVGIFVNEPIQEVVDKAIRLGLDYLQFHGDESPQSLNVLGRPWFKAFRLKDESVLKEISQYECEWILVDAYSQKAYGGTGLVAPWDLVREAKNIGKKLILAGGLNEENIAMAVTAVRPFMVDVSSGVESEPGRKDRQRMAEFIARAKGLG